MNGLTFWCVSKCMFAFFLCLLTAGSYIAKQKWHSNYQVCLCSRKVFKKQKISACIVNPTEIQNFLYIKTRSKLTQRTNQFNSFTPRFDSEGGHLESETFLPNGEGKTPERFTDVSMGANVFCHSTKSTHVHRYLRYYVWYFVFTVWGKDLIWHVCVQPWKCHHGKWNPGPGLCNGQHRHTPLLVSLTCMLRTEMYKVLETQTLVSTVSQKWRVEVEVFFKHHTCGNTKVLKMFCT